MYVLFLYSIVLSLKKYISLERQRTKEPCRLLSLQEGRELDIDKGRKPTPGEKYSRQLKVNKMWTLDCLISICGSRCKIYRARISWEGFVSSEYHLNANSNQHH